MTRPDIEGIEKLASEATPGPWKNHEVEGCHFVWKDNGAPYYNAVCECICDDEGGASPQEQKDAAFIVTARNAIPALLAYIRHLESALPKTVDGVVIVPGMRVWVRMANDDKVWYAGASVLGLYGGDARVAIDGFWEKDCAAGQLFARHPDMEQTLTIRLPELPPCEAGFEWRRVVDGKSQQGDMALLLSELSSTEPGGGVDDVTIWVHALWPLDAAQFHWLIRKFPVTLLACALLVSCAAPPLPTPSVDDMPTSGHASAARAALLKSRAIVPTGIVEIGSPETRVNDWIRDENAEKALRLWSVLAQDTNLDGVIDAADRIAK